MERISAGRLLKVVKALKHGNPIYVTVGNALAYPALNTHTTPERYQLGNMALREIQVMFEDFVNEIQERYPVEKQKVHILDGMEPLRLCIYPGNLEATYEHLGPGVISYLQMAASGLPEEEAVAADDFKSLREALVNLHELAKSVKPALRKVLLELIRLAEDAISKFEIRGSVGLNRALKQMWGELAEVWRVGTESDAEEIQQREAFSAVREFIFKFDAVYAKAVKYVPLLEHVVPLLVNAPMP